MYSSFSIPIEKTSSDDFLLKTVNYKLNYERRRYLQASEVGAGYFEKSQKLRSQPRLLAILVATPLLDKTSRIKIERNKMMKNLNTKKNKDSKNQKYISPCLAYRSNRHNIPINLLSKELSIVLFNC